jgi:hypothetical protein
MRRRCAASHPTLRFETLDMTNMSERLGAASFDRIIDKGTLDAVLAEQRDPWSLEEQPELQILVDAYLAEAKKVLTA